MDPFLRDLDAREIVEELFIYLHTGKPWGENEAPHLATRKDGHTDTYDRQSNT